MTTINCGCACTDGVAIRGPHYTVDKDQLTVFIKEIINNSGTGGSGDMIVPDLRIGMETKMPMRMHGKQVYATLFDCGSLPNATVKNVAHGLTDIDWISVDDDLSRITENTGTYYSANFSSTVAGYSWSTFINKTNISLAAGVNRTAFTAIICVLYTRESETALD